MQSILKHDLFKAFKSNLKDKFLLALIFLVFLFGIYSIFYWKENYKFCSADMDSAIELNVLYNSVSGDIKRFFFSSVQQEYFLFDHLNLTFVFYILAFWFNPTRSMYYFMHGITLAIGALPLYKISKMKLNSEVFAFLISILFIFNPMSISFLKGCLIAIRTYSTIPFLLFTWYFYERKKFGLFAIFIFLSVFTKENIGPLAIMMGLYFLYREKEGKWGFTAIAAGAVVLSIYITALLLSTLPHSGLRVIYSKVLEMHFRTDLDPFYAIRLIPNRLSYLTNIFSLFGFVPLLGAEILVIAIPTFIENLMYSYSYTTIGMDIWIKNNAILVPFLFISIVYGLKRVGEISKIKILPKISKLFVPLLLIFLLSNFALFFIREGDIKEEGFYRKRGIDWRCEIPSYNYNKRWESLMLLKDAIPKSDSLLIDRSLSLVFADRKNLYIWDVGSTHYFDVDINYVLINQELLDCLKAKDPKMEIDITSITMTGDWKKIEEKNGFILFRKL